MGEQGRNISKVTIVLSVVLVVFVGFFIWSNRGFFASMFQAKQQDGYSAVFLTNGQVYFGKIKNEKGGYINLSNVFYLQVKQPLQGSEEQEKPAQPELKLIKLGTELHGPTDGMKINRDQVIFTESLKNESEVIKGINEYYEKNK